MRMLVLVVMVLGCGSRSTPRADEPPAPVAPAPITAAPPIEEPGEVDGMRFIEAAARKPPSGVAPNVFDAVRISSVRILASEAQLAERVNPEALTKFISAAAWISMLAVGMNNQKLEVTVRFVFANGKRLARITPEKGTLDPKMHENMQRGLDGILPLEVKGTLSIAMAFSVEKPLPPQQFEYTHTRVHESGQVVTPGSKVKMVAVQLLTSEDDLALRTKVEDLVAFQKAIHAHAERALAGTTKDIEVRVHVTCTPAGHTISIRTKNKPDDKLVQALHDAITRMPKLATTGEAAFQIYFAASP